MKLYYYDQCPFCVRAIMVANYKQVAVQKIVLQYDDEATCLRLVQAKQVPILEFDDGHAMAESLDIARKFDEIGTTRRKILPATELSSSVSNLYCQVASSLSCLIYPRIVNIALPEFSNQSAINYFQTKKEKVIHRSFTQALDETAIHVEHADAMLRELSTNHLPTTDSLTWDDVVIFPQLRNLTVVKGLTFPKSVSDYIKERASMTDIKLYFDRAV